MILRSPGFSSAVPKGCPGDQERYCSFMFSISPKQILVNMSIQAHFAQRFSYKLYIFMNEIFRKYYTQCDARRNSLTFFLHHVTIRKDKSDDGEKTVPVHLSESRRLVRADGNGTVYTGPGAVPANRSVAGNVRRRYTPKPYWRLRAAHAAEPGGTA